MGEKGKRDDNSLYLKRVADQPCTPGLTKAIDAIRFGPDPHRPPVFIPPVQKERNLESELRSSQTEQFVPEYTPPKSEQYAGRTLRSALHQGFDPTQDLKRAGEDLDTLRENISNKGLTSRQILELIRESRRMVHKKWHYFTALQKTIVDTAPTYDSEIPKVTRGLQTLERIGRIYSGLDKDYVARIKGKR